MIKPGEVDKKANAEKVQATQIQKDYIISWVLWGIAHNEFLLENLVFKGGTCLRKIYFDQYRYSEDMDFTLLDDALENDAIMEAFNNMFETVYDASRIPLEELKDSFGIFEESQSIHFRILYTGTHGADSIKVDITRNERLIFDTEPKTVHCEYSDLTEEDIKVKAYTLEEVLIEKLTALMGRAIPRDLYDFYYLTEIEGWKLDDVYIEFIQKAGNKGHNPKDFIDIVVPKKEIFKRDWEVSLAKQIKKDDLPDFNEVWRKSIWRFKHLMNLLDK